MQHVTEFPNQIEEFSHVPIEMPDGVRLSARIWRPKTGGPVPAILEYLPYRKRDGTAERDALTHPYLAGHGYACVRVDMRGCGDSEGLFEDEYSAQELADGVAVINWLAEQEWCSGSVGMMGISWGGFNGLQIAALAPEPLKAVVSICSTVDRYGDDIHYKGGLMLGENPGWAATVLGWFALPPDPDIVGDGWREMWLERLENTPFLAETWVQHQLRDAYWKHGSVCEEYSAIKAAVLSVGGWHDGYRNTIAHLVENLDAPVKGLVGPWNHKYPHFGMPGPQIDFLGEMLAWWDRWLKDVDNGADKWPDMRAWIMEGVAPQVSYDFRPGRWVALEDWQPVQAPEVFHLTNGGLSARAGPAQATIEPALGCGQGTGEYFPFGFGPGELPDDQMADDALSLCFDSAPLTEDRDLLGAPSVSLQLRSDKTCGQLAVRLCDVRPDGTSALISHGYLNLRHREGHAQAIDLPIGQDVSVQVVLDQCGYRLPAGHRLRVAISSSYWPFVWPEAEQATLQVSHGQLRLPVRDLPQGNGWHFDGPKAAQPLPSERLSAVQETKKITRDGASGAATLDIVGNRGATRDPHTGLTSSTSVQEQFHIKDTDPLSARSSFRWDREMGRDDWSAQVVGSVEMTADAQDYIVQAELTVLEDEVEIFSRKWESRVARS